jgi:phage/plasmid-associated DNA primase/DNA polymerase I-like protein with 3'-5' exonuclease and polymerase domains
MNAQDLSPAPVYASACEKYALAGWPCVIPVPPEAKFPPPGGFTGAGGRDSAPEDIVRWAGERAGDSIALRMPDGIIGIDVDDYPKGDTVKHGARTVAAAEAELGPLPPTWSSTARGPGQPARILFYRVPPGRYASVLGPDVEIIQRHHRYAVVAPSPHYEIGSAYTWYAPDGAPLDGDVPGPGMLAELPPAWVAHLAGGAAMASPVSAAREDGMALLEHVIRDGESACVDMARALGAAATACSAAEAGSRHDQMNGHVYELVMLAAESHPGVGDALDGLSQLWEQLTAGEDRAAEFHDMLLTAARKAATIHGTTPHRQDPCMGIHARVYAAPAPAGPGGGGGPADEMPPPVEPARYWSPYEAIGTEPFDPPAELDGPLARDVLGRTWPVLRYAPDAGTWLIRGPDFWRTRKGDMAKWGVDLVSWLMLPGDAAADKDSPEARQARKRARFCTSATSNGIAGKMNAQVAAGHHTSTVELADLDSEREILWAGGVPYDLRLSREHPEPSRTLDPGMPHLHSAGVVPVAGTTPLWDAFTAVVWPDAELRAWALRVLAVAFTGYPDKALPILLGDTDRGKTQIIMLLMSVLGSYAHVADARLLAAADKSHASIVYALKGRRLSFIDEAPRTGQQATERLKQITGGSELTGNQMHENPVTFSPTHTLILTANPEHEPVLTDAAVRRRLRLIPCDGDPAAVRAARAAIGTENSPAWRREAPAVLAAMMAEAAGWLDSPMSGSNDAAPGSARTAAETIRESQDVIAAWVNEDCEDWDRGTKARDLYTMFTERCRSMNMHQSAIPSETRWGRRLTELGYPPQTHRDANYRLLRVRPPHAFQPTPAEFIGASGGASRPGSAQRASGGGLVDSSKPTLHTSQNGNSAGQTVHQPSTVEGVEGVEGKNHSITHTHTHTRTHENVEKTVHTLQPSTPPAEAPAEAPPPEAAPDPVSSQPVIPGPVPEDGQGPPAKPARKRAAPKPKPEKVRPDPALEGPVHPLPVIVARDPAGGPPLVLPCSPDDARAVISGALEALHVDCETTGYPPGHADFALRLVQLGDEQMAAVLDPADPAQAAVIREALDRARMLHAHSAAADLVPLAAARLGGADAMWAKMTDSVLVAKLADPSLAGSDENQLKKLAAGLLGGYAVSPPAETAKNALFKSGGWLVKTTVLTPREKSGWAMVKPGCTTFARYAGSDVLDLGAVLRVLPKADPDILDRRERPFQEMCARVAHDGFRLDPEHIGAKIPEHEQAREEAREVVARLCPAITNPSSTSEVPAALAAMGIPLGLTKDGNLSAAKDVLGELAADEGYEHHELLNGILGYRHHVTTLGLLLEPLGRLCSHGDGRMRPVVYTINADTGRTSCVRPNGQQFSRQGGIRACVIADPGLRGISADFSGVEIRVAAALSGDMELLAAELSTRCLACEHDPCACGANQTGLHWMAARMAWGPGATKENRYSAKRIIFSKLFGGSAKAGARQTGVPYEAALAVHRAFEAIAPGYAEWDRQMRAYSDAGNRAFLAYSGRTIWLPKGRAHAAGNYAIQGTAREALVDGCLRWRRTPWGHLPLLPIHDEILLFVPADEADEALAALVACMRMEIYGVPIEAKADEPFLAWPDSS